MSIRRITDVWADSPYEGTRLLIHLALADISNDAGRFFASQTDLAKKGRCSVEYVRKVIKEMIIDGYIEIVTKGSSRGKATVYQLLRKQPPNFVGELKSEETGQPPNSDNTNPPTLTGQHPNSTPYHPSYTPVLNTTKESSEKTSLDISEICSYLANAIEKRGLRPQPKPGAIQGARWASEARLLLAGKIGKGDTLEDRGGLTVAQIKGAIDYAMNDIFWAVNILSPGKLRKQYPTLRAQAQAAREKPAKGLITTPTQIPPHLTASDFPSGGVPMPAHVRELARASRKEPE